MTKKLRIGVIFGGRSGEHEVSVRSAGAVIQAIDSAKYEVVPIAITKEGNWLAPAAAAELLPAAAQRYLSARTFSGKKEDVPFVGCGTLASACGMDKVAMKALFRNAGLPICDYAWFLRTQWESEPESISRRIIRSIGFPAFVKPANLGSSVGISKATDKASLVRSIELAARYDRKVIVEKAVAGREIECAVMGNDKPQASLPGEYVIHDEAARFLDYNEKYAGTGNVEFVVPARIPKTTAKKIQLMAIQAFQSIDGSGLARVDFFLRPDGSLL